MAKKKEAEAGEQLQLIDVTAKNAKPLVAAAKLYKKYQKERMAAGVKEKDQKDLILDLVKKSDLQRLKDGKIKFEVDGMKFVITPRDELVQITEKKKAPDPSK